MLRLEIPTISAVQSFDACRTKVQGNLADRLNSSRSEVEEASIRFQQLALSGSLLGTADAFDLSTVSRDEMQYLYDSHMVGRSAAGRDIYNKLRLMSPNSICPMCCQRDVSTLDHYLPKTKYSALAVNPYNLVPCCADCNKIKGTLTPEQLNGGLIHPYFEDTGSEVWLKASVVERKPATLAFSVAAPISWTEPFRLRVQTHFTKLRLASLYRIHAVGETNNVRNRLSKLYARAGPAAVKSHLVEEWETRSGENPNSWQTATYSALSQSEWYCDEGFAID